MKTKVNKVWYNQSIQGFKEAKNEEIRLIKLQHDRYFNYPKQFDVDRQISKDKILEFLNEAVKNLGSSEIKLKSFISKYEPCETIKPNWKEVENYLLLNKDKINTSVDIHSKYDAYYVISEFFCNAKWAIPQSEKNSDRMFRLFYKCGVELY
jgi:hypothetical protein